jgi:hypothetical protein
MPEPVDVVMGVLEEFIDTNDVECVFITRDNGEYLDAITYNPADGSIIDYGSTVGLNTYDYLTMLASGRGIALQDKFMPGVPRVNIAEIDDSSIKMYTCTLLPDNPEMSFAECLVRSKISITQHG